MFARVLVVACSLWLASGVAVAPVAVAQVVSPAEEARTQFEAGTTALREGRYEDAVVHLERSHALLPNVPNGFNLAVALLRAGRPRESLAILRALEDGLHGAPSEAQRVAITQRIAETLTRVAQYEIVVERGSGGPASAEDVVIAIDGETVATLPLEPGAQATRHVELDPGDHVIVVSAPSYASRSRSVAASAGSTSLTSFVLTPTAPADAPATPPSGGIDETALWIGIVAGVVVLAAVGIVLGVLLDQPPGPVVDPVTGIGETLSVTPPGTVLGAHASFAF